MATGDNPTEELTTLCERVYDASTSSADRSLAVQQLEAISQREDILQHCMALLEGSTSPYAQVFACQTLTTLLSRTTGVGVKEEQRLQMLNYILSYFGSHPQMPNFVVNSLCKLFARLSKTSWFDIADESTAVDAPPNAQFVFRQRYEAIVQMISTVDPSAGIVCIQLLKAVLTEMNSWTSSPSLTEHRRIAVAFRDNQLMDTFEMCAVALHKASGVPVVEGGDAVRLIPPQSCTSYIQNTLLGHVLDLCHKSLTFDFHMSLADETTADETSALQVPAGWKTLILDNDMINVLFKFVDTQSDDVALHALQCVVQLCGIRRTVLNQTERMAFLRAIMQGVLAVFAKPTKLQDKRIYHAFCRLLARLKGTFQLTEMVKCSEEYAPMINAVTEFTVQSLSLFEYASDNSLHFLLSFWHRTVGSMTYTRSEEPHLLDTHVPLVVEAYINSRMVLTFNLYSSSTTYDDPLDDLASLSQQMEQFAVIARCEYDRTVKCILDLLRVYGEEYTAGALTEKTRNILHGRFAWLTFMVGACIGGRVSFSTVEENDVLDGDMISRILQLMAATDAQLDPLLGSQPSSNVKLELSYLYLMEQFRKTYISDQVQRLSQVYARMGDLLGLADEAALMAVMARKIVRNLRCWSSSCRIMEDSLTLLSDLSIGYTSSRRLKELDDIRFVIANHSANEFVLLSPTCDVEAMKSRTKFYTAISRLMVVDLGDDDQMLEEYMRPIGDALKGVANIIYDDVPNVEAKHALIGVCRDLRGVCLAFNTKSAFAMLFDYLYPDYLAVITKGMELFYDDPSFTSPCLRLMAELSENRSQRLCFEANSPSAILIFKQCSRIMCIYGEKILQLPIPSADQSDELYKRLLKGIAICFNTLRQSIHGNSVNFGVFVLYSDDSLTSVLNMAFKLMAAIPDAAGRTIVKYSKLAHAYFNLMEVLAAQHMSFLSSLPVDAFVFVLRTLQEGVNSLNTQWVTTACSTLDELMTYVYKRVRRQGKRRRKAGQPPEGDSGLQALQTHPHIFQNLLESFMNGMIYEECKCQWSMSRPLLPLILLQPQAWDSFKTGVLRNTSRVEHHQPIVDAFDTLMADVGEVVSVRTKDKFTNNITLFRREITDILKGRGNEGKVVGLPSGDNDDML